jgi:hypothetical protein
MTNKKFLIGMPVLLIAALFFLGCPTDSDDEPGDNPSVDEPAVVSALALDAAVGTPVFGAEGKTAVDAAQYSGPIVWTPGLTEGKFAARQAYTAAVTLTAKPDFTFVGFEADSFTHGGATTVLNGEADAEGAVTVTVVFPATAGDPLNPVPVEALDLSGAIAEPVAGAAAGGFTSPDSTQYSGGAVTWDPEPADGKFAGSTSYTAAVTLTAGTGYTFDGAGDFAYGTLAVTKTANDDGTVTVAVAFGPTALAVTALNLSGAIDAPVTGAAPVYVFTTPGAAQFDGGTVTWDPVVEEGGAFAAGTVYKASVTLAPAEGYTLAGAEFAYAGATAVLDGDVVTVTFGATDAVVSALNLAALIPAPAKNQTAQSAVDGAQYAGPVTWKDTANKPLVGTQFGAATGYTATATLAPLPGFTFTGFEGKFFHGNLVVHQTLNELAGTVEVELTFTDTEDSESWLAIEFEPARVVSSTGSLAGIVLVKGGETVKLTVAATGSSYGIGNSAKWYLDGNATALKDGVSGNTLTLDPAKYGVRESDHHVTVTVTADSKSYSVTVPFKVTAAGN